MRIKVLEQGSAKAWAVVLETGDEFIESLSSFAEANGLTAASFTGIGALRKVVLGYFEWDRKEYKRIPIEEQVEVLALTGDVSLDKGRPKLHAHVVLGKPDGSAWGGHVMEAHVRPTLELVVRETPATLRRAYDPESGLNLIKP